MTREFICGQQTLLTCTGELVGFGLLLAISLALLGLGIYGMAKSRR